MAATKIFVIYNNTEYNKEEIVQIIKDEQYPHIFYFGAPTRFIGDELDMLEAKEVWVFGNCDKMPDFAFAKKHHKDIWVMG